jgi:hypothetical protein
MHHFSTALSEQHRDDLLTGARRERLARSVDGAPRPGRGRWNRLRRATRD